MDKFAPSTLAAMGLGRSVGEQPTGTQSAQDQAAQSANVGAAPRKFGSMGAIGNVADDLASELSIPVAMAIGIIVWLYLRYAE